MQSDHRTVRLSTQSGGSMELIGRRRHAGYSYSGPAAAWAYRSVDVSDMCAGWSDMQRVQTADEAHRSERVFILGPSHHAYLDGCALSVCTDYATPLGSLTLDRDSEFIQTSLVPKVTDERLQRSRS